MRLNMLGTLELVDDEGVRLELGGPRQRAVLTALAMHGAGWVSRDALIEAVWTNRLPANPGNTLRHYIARLRAILGANGAIETWGSGYVLHLDTDIAAAESVIADGRRLHGEGRLGPARSRYLEALAMWRGEPLADFAYADFAQPEIRRLNELQLSVVESAFEAGLAIGLHRELIPELEAATTRHPTAERLWGQLMVALYRAGRQADALAAYRKARFALVEELGIEPTPELEKIETRILVQDPSLTSWAATVSRGNLGTETTPFVGRGELLDQITRELEEHRLVSLIGPAGIGKTRLATELGRRNAHLHPDGVWLVSLDDTSDGQIVDRVVAAVLRLAERPHRRLRTVLLSHLAERTALIILDGSEQAADAVADLTSDLLLHCPTTRTIVTSQHRLRLAAGSTVAVPPLQTRSAAAEGGELSESVELFMSRARMVMPDFEPHEQVQSALERICASIDGVPLAIELAAARVRSLNPEQIETGLADRFGLLSRDARDIPIRFRSLQAALDRSLDLLSSAERRLFPQLGVFVGPFDLAAIEAVTDLEPGEQTDLVEQLIDHSLLLRIRNLEGAARYRLLSTVREYARSLLPESDLANLQRRHAEHYAELAASADRGLRSATHRSWLENLDGALENLRAALTWATTSAEPDIAVRLAARLGRYWDWRGTLSEGILWLDRALGLESTHRDRALVLVWRSFFSLESGDLPTASDLAQLALEISGEQHRPAALGNLSLIERSRGNHAAALEYALAAADEATASTEIWFAAWARTAAAMAALESGRREQARNLAHSAVGDFVRVGDQRGEAWCMAIDALLAASDGVHELASAALLAAHSAGDIRTVVWMLHLLAEHAPHGGAVALLSAAHSLRAERAQIQLPGVLVDPQLQLENARASLDPSVFEDAWRRGERLDLGDVLDLAAPAAEP